MTIPELLISVVVLGAITAVLASAITVTLRQQRGSDGRLNVARAEQNLSMWIPADLASASTANTDPAATPCGAACPSNVPTGGSNALLLEWSTETHSGSVLSKVSYYFMPSATADTFELIRVLCTSTSGGSNWTCETNVVLRDLPGPPGGAEFVPGVTTPDWVIIVSHPLAPDAIGEELPPDGTPTPPSQTKDAKRVVVTVDGGGDAAGSGGGVNRISITAGGTVRNEISASSMQGAPSFVEARSRCGGAMVLIVDESNSVGAAVSNVQAGVEQFVRTLAGTPVQLQVVRFHTRASVLGSSDWTRYFDLTEPSEVSALLAAIPQLRGSWSGTDGGTNWEDAFFRTFHKPDGTIATTIPETVVFFTDGVPTFDRIGHRGAPGQLVTIEPHASLRDDTWPVSNGNQFSQVAFDRANNLAKNVRTSVRLIGVGVGGDINGSSYFFRDPGAGLRYMTSPTRIEQRVWTYSARYQTRASASADWVWVTKATYDAAPGSSTGSYPRKRDAGWTTIDANTYRSLESPANDNDADGVRRSASWQTLTTTQVNQGQLANSKILAQLIAGNDNATRAIPQGDSYSNVAVADLYIEPNWSRFGNALTSIALGECGGTLTLQTRLANGAPAPDPFRYQNSAMTDSVGAPVPMEPTVVTTNAQFVTGTFDFSIPNGQFVDVDILPQNFSELRNYTPGSWSCRAGTNARPASALPINDTAWSGVRVRVAANEAVSCTLTVSRS